MSSIFKNAFILFYEFKSTENITEMVIWASGQFLEETLHAGLLYTSILQLSISSLKHDMYICNHV